MEGIVGRLEEIVGAGHMGAGRVGDPLTHDATFVQGQYLAAVHPADTEEVAAVVRSCADAGVPVVARGSGTSLVGGPVPLGGGVVLCLDRLNRLEIDAANTCAVAGAGVITGELQAAAGRRGLMYPPDPGSVNLSTIGGNVACNAGGMCCLKYGVTADYVIGLTAVLADGTVLRLGGKTRKRSSGYRLLQLFIGSEGTLGIVTEVIVKLVPLPRYRATAIVGYERLEDAAAAVSRILASGHFPAALEIMDRGAADLVAEHFPPGFRRDLEGVLIVEQDGNDEQHVQAELERTADMLGGVDRFVARDGAQREAIWSARRHFGMALLKAPRNCFAEDVAVPIAAIPEMVRRVRRLAEEMGLTVVTVGHAGDGNLHPTVFFRDDQRHLVGPAAARMFRDAIDLGGSISAEHGLGALKRDYAELEHGPEVMRIMREIKDVLDPAGLLNPHKVFPEGPADDAFLDRQPGWRTALTPGGHPQGDAPSAMLREGGKSEVPSC
ncbi:MAG: FAD-binding protein [Chloroflexi bacterium]|nr:FAD-binding protein [Chloroflexota bacterium]